MESRFKELYDAPSVMILEVEQEGVICASGETEGYGNGKSSDESFFDQGGEHYETYYLFFGFSCHHINCLPAGP